MSLELIKRTGSITSARIIDVGGGASTLVDDLFAEGFDQLTVLDISSAALKAAMDRLGRRSSTKVTWVEADITQAVLPHHFYDVWHDRAVFHFLTDEEDRHCYISAARQALKPGGYIIIATFAADGPLKCSGLEIVRYSPEKLQAEFGESFELLESFEEKHQTPFDTTQNFIYCTFRKGFTD